MSRYDRDSEYGEKEDGVRIDQLIEDWKEYVPQVLEPFNLIMSEYHGRGSLSTLNEIMRGGIRNIEREFPAILDLARERIYMRFWQTAYKFLRTEGYNHRVDPRIEFGSNERVFWEEYLRNADRVAIHNIWDLFKYKVAVITYITPLAFNQMGNRRYTVYPDARLNNLEKAIGSNRGFKEFFSGTFPDTGTGFVAGVVNGDDIVKSVLNEEDHIKTSVVYAGIHNWDNGTGCAYRVPIKDFTIPFATSVIDTSDRGVYMHYRGITKPHKKAVV